MEGYGSSSYGDGFADVYDRWYRDLTDTDACVERLASLARPDRPVLELGVGTGRLAIPLAATGLTVWGVDSSAAMLAELRAKPGGDRVHVALGDMADLGRTEPPLGRGVEPGVEPDVERAGGPFGLAFAAYNTLYNLTDPDGPRRCLEGVVQHLASGGRFVVEGFVPALDPDGRRDDVAVSRIAAAELVLTATLHDADAQTVTGQHVQITEAGVRLRPWVIRYLLPRQLDELAATTGLVLEQRWSDWSGRPFDDTSPVHVSVYRRPA